jgi:protein-S-isoprenylcysteine O-methyltransferase Ste14
MELKIPPVLLTLIVAALMWLISKMTPVVFLPGHIKAITAVLFVIAAASIGLAGVAAFRQAETTVNPLSPGNCSSLVDSGIFRFTRNPMYLSLLVALTAWGVFLGSPWALILVAFFVLFISRYQIKPEERALEAAFGESFLQYKLRVRRWL